METDIITNPQEQDKGLSKKEMECFIGENSKFYLKKWNQKKRWNWAAFFGGMLWLGYRKMYLVATWIIVAFILFDVVQFILNIHTKNGLETIVGIVLGLSGNSFYYSHMRSRVDKIQSLGIKGQDYYDEIKKAGGTSWLGVLIVSLMIIGYAALSLLLFHR